MKRHTLLPAVVTSVASWTSLLAAQACPREPIRTVDKSTTCDGLAAATGSVEDSFGSLSLLQKRARERQDESHHPGAGVGVSALQVDDIFTRLDTSHSRLEGATLADAQLGSQEFQAALQRRNEVCMPPEVEGDANLTHSSTFHHQVHRGRTHASSKGIVFAGLLRDVQSSVTALFMTLRAAGKSFARYHIIALENDSRDNTRWRLGEECQSPDSWCFLLHVPSLQTSQDQHVHKRIYHLTQLRQALLEQVRHLISTSSEVWDYVMMFDGDLFAEGSKGFSPPMLDALLGLRMEDSATMSQVYADDPWDVVCANQIANWPNPGRYRDTFALRQTSFIADLKGPIDAGLYYTGNQLDPVKSCFSGLALYRTKALVGTEQCNYSYIDERVCEHIPFHYCLSTKGFKKFAIYPPLVVATNDKGLGTPKETCANLMSFPSLQDLPVR
mmetsp:Transcript_143150/g.275015  ORF Transcript_143150/g.275015 Transcript_143150/m.275015 type:complete len:443 (+) Transcript_143150:54-1382(+)